ncbi:hypothetical protein Peur_041995 [Populus x canadensis]
MYEWIEDRFNALENGIRKYATALFTSGLMRNRWTPQLRTFMLIKLCIRAFDLNYCFKEVYLLFGMICCDGEGRLNEKVHHAEKQVISLVEGEEQRKSICINPGTQAKGQGGGTFAELKYHGSDKMNASITIGIQILDLNSVRDVPNSKWHKAGAQDQN